ncbi:hypothetical protein [Streptomyces sp. NPDC002788]
MFRRIRRASFAVAAALSVTAALSGTATTAMAAPAADGGQVTCLVNATITFTPGLTLYPTPQHIQFDVHYSGCTSATGSPVTGGAHSGSFDGLRGCLYDPAPTGMTFDVDWDEGPDSHVVGLAKGEDLGGQSVHTITGAVTGGQFMGSSFEEVINQNSLDLRQCATTGVKSQSGTGFVTITPGAAG